MTSHQQQQDLEQPLQQQQQPKSFFATVNKKLLYGGLFTLSLLIVVLFASRSSPPPAPAPTPTVTPSVSPEPSGSESSDGEKNGKEDGKDGEPVIVPSCETFDPKKVKLVTFDLFAALMDVDTSLLESVANILPTLTSEQVTTLVRAWERAYSSYAGVVFDQKETGVSPFQWSIRKSLDKILVDMEISDSVTGEDREKLVAAWGVLTPWKGTEQVLEKLYKANFKLAVLSNGDRQTLQAATSVFVHTTPFTEWYSSDFPVGAFKPHEAMYTQVLAQMPAEEVFHVAGAPKDGWGSRKAGMYSALLRDEVYPSLPEHEPCFVLADITDLPAVLGLE
eukprot:GDKI01010344.1.p1 GENE.GDKI01010344.1~~GDKI01010344.1.p1  ORF type:complete len:335 (+),score=89.68 GDKI01010344.1:216-1220(+)